MEEKLKDYFQLFSDKNLEGLSEMFSETVSLTDWEISAYGKSDVLEANRKIFESVQTIAVHPYSFYGADNAYAVELSIEVNGGTDEEVELQVVDVITFNDEGLIETITAYKK